MSVTTPPVISPSGPARPARVPWLVLVGLAALLTILYYTPALFGRMHEPSRHNVVTALTGLAAGPASGQFYAGWEQSRVQLVERRVLPLWSPAFNQPLLERTEAPLLYPGAVIYYLGGVEWGPLGFSLVHLGLLAAGLAGLIRVGSGPGGRSGRLAWGAAALAVWLVAGSLRPDYLAALAWVPIAMLTAEWRRQALAGLSLTLVAGLLALAGPLWVVGPGYMVILVWWVWRRRLANGPGKSAGVAGLLALALAGGLFLAGPQLFPRLAYGGPGVAPEGSAGAGLGMESATGRGAEVRGFSRESDGEVAVSLLVPARSEQIEVYVLSAGGGPAGSVSARPNGWNGQLSGPDGRRAGELKISQGATPAELVASIKFDQKNSPQETAFYNLRLRYLPMSFTLGAYATFLTLASLALLAVVRGWVRFYREDEGDHPLRRVVKNSATPLFAQFSGKIIDFGYAIFVLRLLGPEGNGEYTFAVLTWVFFAGVCDFGLEGIVTREVARARQQNQPPEYINRLFVTKLVVRMVASIAALPVALVWIGGFSLWGNLTAATGWAIILLMVGFWPSAVAGSITAVFRGYEKFEYLAAGQLLAAVIKVPLGLGALLAGWGVIGLAGASVIVNLIQVAVLHNLMVSQLFRPRWRREAFDPRLARQLLGQSYPLMLNGLIITLLFKSDGLILGTLKGNTQLGIYNAAYKFIDAFLIIPSTLTMALFPIFSIYGAEAKASLLRAYREGLRLLLIIALPVAGGILFVAYDLIGFLGGAEYLPGGAIALQILIWFLPFSYINGITQYVLIAVDRQRSITGVVVAAAAINITLNLVLIPVYGYLAAAFLTILTELVMLVPFCWIMRRALGPGAVPLLAAGWRPVFSAGLMTAALAALQAAGFNHFGLVVGVGALVYLAGLGLTRAITRQDVQLLRKVLRR